MHSGGDVQGRVAMRPPVPKQPAYAKGYGAVKRKNNQ